MLHVVAVCMRGEARQLLARTLLAESDTPHPPLPDCVVTVVASVQLSDTQRRNVQGRPYHHYRYCSTT